MNVEQTRPAELSGKLMSDVDFGFENSGRAAKGDEPFEVGQSDVA
jgi:hypothetical protein